MIKMPIGELLKQRRRQILPNSNYEDPIALPDYQQTNPMTSHKRYKGKVYSFISYDIDFSNFRKLKNTRTPYHSGYKSHYKGFQNLSLNKQNDSLESISEQFFDKKSSNMLGLMMNRVKPLKDSKYSIKKSPREFIKTRAKYLKIRSIIKKNPLNVKLKHLNKHNKSQMNGTNDVIMIPNLHGKYLWLANQFASNSLKPNI